KGTELIISPPLQFAQQPSHFPTYLFFLHKRKMGLLFFLRKRKMGLLTMIKKHYSTTHYERSDTQLEREKWLLPGVKFNRYFLMPAAVFIQVRCTVLKRPATNNNNLLTGLLWESLRLL